MAFSNYNAAQVLPDGTMHVQLHTANPGDDGTVAPASGIGRSSGTFGNFASKSNSNTTDIVFNSVPAQTITHVSLWDASSGGNCLFYHQISAPFVVTDGQTLTFAIGDFINTLT